MLTCSKINSQLFSSLHLLLLLSLLSFEDTSFLFVSPSKSHSLLYFIFSHISYLLGGGGRVYLKAISEIWMSLSTSTTTNWIKATPPPHDYYGLATCIPASSLALPLYLCSTIYTGPRPIHITLC